MGAVHGADAASWTGKSLGRGVPVHSPAALTAHHFLQTGLSLQREVLGRGTDENRNLCQ